MLIGLGHHARRIYYPIFKELSNKYNLIIVDKKDQEYIINKYIKKINFKPIVKLFTTNFSTENKNLPNELIKNLNDLVSKHKIKGVIISTDPLYHKHYAKWALKNNLSVLMDKPISIYKNISTDSRISGKLTEDYNLLNKLYKKSNKKVLFSIVSQRRFHKGFIKIKELIDEVFKETNCPITSIQISHSDGQWRLPTEIVDIDYHSYNLGFGKCSHSGYHFFDIINYFFEGINGNKSINNVDIQSNFMRPIDFLNQITIEDYKSIFNNFNRYNKYKLKEYYNKMKNYGEIDAFINFSFKRDKNVIALGSLNLIHNSFSQRSNVKPNNDLYKGNGRVRHETYTIQQGPYQCIQIISFQSKEIRKGNKTKYNLGGEYHFEIFVFRNNKLVKKWKNYQKISIKNLQRSYLSGFSRGHQEDARRFATIEFLDFLNGKIKKNYVSDFSKHKNSVRIMAGIYKSGALRYNNKNSLVNINYD